MSLIDKRSTNIDVYCLELLEPILEEKMYNLRESMKYVHEIIDQLKNVIENDKARLKSICSTREKHSKVFI